MRLQVSTPVQVFASSRIGRGLNVPFLPPSSAAANPRLVLVPAFQNGSQWLMLVSSDGGAAAAASASWALRVAPYTFGDVPSAANVSHTLQLDGSLADVVCFGSGDGNSLFAVASTGAFQLLSYDASSGAVSSVTTGQLPGLPSKEAVLVAATMVTDATTATDYFITLQASTAAVKPPSLSVVAVAVDVNTGATAERGRAPVQSTWAVTGGASLALLQSSNNTWVGMALYSAPVPINATASRPTLFAAHLNVSLPANAGANITFTVSNNGASGGATPTRVGFGSAPHITAAAFGGAVMVLAVHTDGTCQCGQGMNNGGLNHCDLPLPASDNDPAAAVYQSVPHLLNYNYGTLAAWHDLADPPADAGDRSPQHLSACSPSILSGAHARS
jgi:hypothetical protein